MLINAMWESFVRAWIRFWDNRFNPNAEVEWLRLEIEKQRLETHRLQDILLEIAAPKPVEPETQIDLKDLKPIGRPDWRVRARMLEEKSRAEKALRDAEIKSPKSSTEALEQELGIK